MQNTQSTHMQCVRVECNEVFDVIYIAVRNQLINYQRKVFKGKRTSSLTFFLLVTLVL